MRSPVEVLEEAALAEREGGGVITTDGARVLFNGREIARFASPAEAEEALRAARKRHLD